MSNPFSSGPRLLDPSGDPKRQAVDALRGYAYQLYVSALAWIRLNSNERLYLEVAEDYAIAAEDSLKGVQVKDTLGSGSITINSQDVREALDNFVDLVERNPDTRVTLRFLSTSPIGREREISHRVNGQAVLEYWQQAARNAEVKPLRDAILRADISDRVRLFVQARSDKELRVDLLQKISWDCGEPGLADVKLELSSALVSYGSDRLRLLPSDSEPLTAVVLQSVLDSVLRTEPKTRYVDSAALLHLCADAGRTSLPNSMLESIMAQQSGQQPLQGIAVPSVLESLNDAPMPTLLLPRHDVVQSVTKTLESTSVAILSAGTGMGKSVVARLSARASGGKWMMVDLRDVAAEECEFRLKKALGEAAATPLEGIILDDLNELNVSKVAAALARLLRSLKRHNSACIVTCYKELSSSVLEKLGLDAGASLRIPSLSQPEVAYLVQMTGGDATQWTSFVHYAGGNGHPQLVRVVLAGLKQRGWPITDIGEPTKTEIGADIEEERGAIRRNLMNALDTEPRNFLYRASLALGRFKRQIALQLGEIEPGIHSAGEYLDILIGPWIDNLGSGMLRISPLVANAGESALLPSEQAAVHRMFAENLFQTGKLDVTTVDDLFIHSIKGKSEAILIQLGGALLKARNEELKIIAEWFPSLRFAPLDSLIVPKDPEKAILFRLNQFVIAASLNDKTSHPLNVWKTLESEIKASDPQNKGMLQTMAIGKALCLVNLPAILPDWFSLLRKFRASLTNKVQLTPAFGTANQHSGLFISQAIHVGSVNSQLSLFEELHHLNRDEREEYLEFALETREGTAALVNGPWLEEVRSGKIDGRSACEAHLKMADFTRSWGHSQLTILLLVAASIMLDEYSADPHSALELIKQAEAEFGTVIDLARARSKIYLRQRKHHDVISIVRDIDSQLGEFEPLERMFLRRETAISFAETGDWKAAASQFSQAHTDALAVASQSFNAIALGLKADSALALYRAGDLNSAIEVYREVLQQLPDIDSEDSLQAAYCSRVIRHGLLWLHVQVIGAENQPLINGDPAFMIAGMCSNPNPPEDIVDLPRANLDATWYLFATAESDAVGPTQALHRLETRLNGRTAPTFELTFRSYILNNSIKNLVAHGFADQLHRWLDFVAHAFNGETPQISEIPVYAVVPRTSKNNLQAERLVRLQKSAIYTFGVSAALSGNISALKDLRADFENHVNLHHAVTWIDKMLVPDPEDLDYNLADSIHTVLTGPELFITQLFGATLRFLEVAIQSEFRAALEAPLTRWSHEKWKQKIESKLAFNRADIVIPNIQLSLRLSGVASVAAIILAAEPAMPIQLNSKFRELFTKTLENPPETY